MIENIANKFPLSQETTRSKLLMNATILFSEDGYEETSIRTLASKSDVSLALMYNYFSSKESLLETIVGIQIERIGSELNKLLDDECSLESYLNHLSNDIRSNYHVWRIIMNIRFKKGLLTEKIRCFDEKINDDLAGIVSLHSPEIKEEAFFLVRSLDGIIMDYLVKSEDSLFENSIKALIARYAPPNDPSIRPFSLSSLLDTLIHKFWR